MTNFPTINDIDIAFPALSGEEIKNWIKEAEEAKFDPQYIELARQLFFKGGQIQPGELFEKDPEEYKKGIRYLKRWLGSYAPKHEDKELVAGYILSRIAKLPGV